MNRKKEFHYYLSKAKHIAARSSSDELNGLVMQKYGYNYYYLGKHHQAIKEFSKSITLLKSKGSEYDIIKTHIYLGCSLFKLGKFEPALLSLHTALKESRQKSIYEDVTLCYLFLGELFIAKGKYTSAISHLKKALKYEERIGRKVALAQIYENIFKAYWKISNKTLAMKNFRISLNIYRNLNMTKKIESLENAKRQLT